jgi:hypothetical protein
MKLKRLSEMTLEDWKNLPECRELTPEEKADIYRQYRESFTAADLAEYAQLDEGVLADEFLADLEEIAREYYQAKGDDQKQS